MTIKTPSKKPIVYIKYCKSGEPWHFKPVFIPYWHSFLYNGRPIMVPMQVDIFWLWFCINIKLHVRE